RQAIDEIDVDRMKAGGAARLDDADRLLDALNAVDSLLHSRVEVLHAQTRPIEAEAAPVLHVRRGGEARVELNREIEVCGVSQAEIASQNVDETCEVGLS